MHRQINPETVVKSFGNYSQAIEIDPHKRWIFTAGQVGVNKNGTTMPSFEKQAEQTWENIFNILKDAGMHASDIVKINGFIVGDMNLSAYKAAREQALNNCRPASTLIVVPALAMPEWLIEIEAIAAK